MCLYWRLSGAFIVNFEHISRLVPVFMLAEVTQKISYD